MRYVGVALLVIAIGIGLFALGFYVFEEWPRNPVALKPDLITVASPRIGDVVSSPLTVTGKARGHWFFEASFPVRLLDETGKELAIVPAQAQGEWMTEDFVPFEAKLEFDPPDTGTGVLILEKDNPSGLPEYADELRVPVRFK